MNVFGNKEKVASMLLITIDKNAMGVQKVTTWIMDFVFLEVIELLLLESMDREILILMNVKWNYLRLTVIVTT